MSWLFSQALVAEYSVDTFSDGAPSAPSNGTPTPQAYLWRDRTTAAWRRFPSGMTCKPLTDDRGEAVLTSFLAAFHARTFQSPEKAQASTDKQAACGDTWRESSVRYDRDSSSWKTHRCLFTEVLPESSVTLPRWGSMRDGVCWERTTSARPTSGTASGLWPTPNLPTGGRSVKHVTDWRGRTAYHNGKKVQVGLEAAVKLWPTPTVDDRSNVTRKSGKFQSLTRKVMFPTPQASDCRNRGSADTPAIARRIEAGKQITLTMTVTGGQLNPTWVEWLMGWPLEWTALDALETDKYQR
jgi:hypothetical protein